MGARDGLRLPRCAEKLDLIRLPEEADDPLVLRFDPANDPVIRLYLTGGENLFQLRYVAEEVLKKDLESTEGVAAIKVNGGFEEEIQVPLIVHLPGRPELARRVEERVRLIDLGPTLAQLAGTSLRGGLLEPEGRSFAALVFGKEGWEEPEIFAQRRPRDEKRRLDGWIEGPVYMLRDERYKVIVEGAEGASLFELARDPNELDDLSDRDPRLTEDLVRQAREHYEALERQGAALGSGTIRSEHVDELKALGY